jgi:hypothetical protein
MAGAVGGSSRIWLGGWTRSWKALDPIQTRLPSQADQHRQPVR